MLYNHLATLYEDISKTSKRLEKTHLISLFLKNLSDDLSRVILLLRGVVFPQWDERKLGLSEKLLIKAISVASGATDKTIMDTWRNLGDIGEVAQQLLSAKTQSTLFSEELTISHVFSTLQKLASIEGAGSVDAKVKLIAQLLTNAKGVEAKFIARTVIGDLRVGVAEGTLRDAIAWAFLFSEEDINYAEGKINPTDRESYNNTIAILQKALDKSNDFTLAAKAAKKGLSELQKIKIIPGNPLKVMLAQKVSTFADAFEKVGSPCAAEYKMDGFRLQINKSSEIKLFTRRLENVTKQFPDVVDVIKDLQGEFILDAEAVGKEGEHYKPFQEISQRIRRKYDIEDMAKKLPVELDVFDILYYNGEEMITKPFKERRALLEQLIPTKKGIRLAPQKLIHSEEEGDAFYEQALADGNEGLMIKSLDAPYQPGSRVGTMIKLKPTLETFDVVIVGAEWGTGKRSGWLTSFTVACFDDESQELLTLGKFGTGIKEKADAKEEHDVTFEEITALLKPHITDTDGRGVTLKPEVVVEVTFEEVQASTSYSSGFALRFPRFVRLRDDKSAHDVTRLSFVRSVYAEQRGRNG